MNAETLRTTNEDTRKTAETQRAAAETVREGNEQARKTAETQRAGAEATRQTNEQTRQNQEQARQTAEVLRATAEQERKTAETQRAAAETTRQTNEQTRQSNEQARKTAEAQRETNEQNRKDSFVEEIDQAKSWAVGGTGKRHGEDTNNAKYWSEQAKANVGGDFATNERVDQVEAEVDRVAQSVTDLETQVEQDVGQAIQQVNQTISGLEQSVNTRVQPINLGGTGASEANQARQNLGAAAVKEMTKAEYDALPAIDPTIFYALTDVEADGVKIEVGSYVGTGTYGARNPNRLTFGFEPKLVIVGASKQSNGTQGYFLNPNSPGWSDSFLWVEGQTYSLVASYDVAFTKSGKTLSWYSEKVGSQCNNSAVPYFYIAIG